MLLPSKLLRSLCKYALAGAAASLLLTVVELIDLNISASGVLRSAAERLILCTYFSLNLVSGALIGIFVGVVAAAGALTTGLIDKGLTKRASSRTIRRLMGSLAFGLVAALLLGFQPEVHKYILWLLIEAQKVPFVYDDLVSIAAYLIPLVILALIAACWGAFTLARVSGRLGRLPRAGLRVLALAMIATAYLLDSRYQVQLYEFSFHRSMFLLTQGATMVLMAGIYYSSAGVRGFISSVPRSPGWLRVVLLLLLSAPVGFTFSHFGKNQTLKVLLFTRTTQAKQHFKLAQWVLDFDRDGYSAVLGGDDADDTRAKINPEVDEVLDDGIDNNQLGGDLTLDVVAEWLRDSSTLHGGQPGPDRRFLNLIYVFIDAARADHFGAYRYHRNTTPNLDKLAARSTLFENAFSPAANTFESAPRFMTSSYWSDGLEAWTEVLSRNGYDTVLFPEKRLFMLERYVKGVRVDPGSDGKPLEKNIDRVITAFSASRPNRPFGAYVYAFDPHMPYNAHEEFDFGSSIVDLYDGELAFTDYHLGRLFDWLDHTGHMNDTMIVVMADHGESLGERGVWRHSSQLYNEQTHVPMIVYAPSFSARRVEDYVTAIDLGPTILDAVGIACPEECAGVSLLPLMDGKPFSHPPIYASQIVQKKDFREVREEPNLNAKLKKYMIVSQEGYKLIYSQQHQVFELFDLKADPGELNNLYDALPSVSNELRRKLGTFLDIESSGGAQTIERALANTNAPG